MDKTKRKLVIVGDGACGKSSLLTAFLNGIFVDVNHVSSLYDRYVADIDVDGKPVEFSLWDVSGQYDYHHNRPGCYPNSHVILVCFNIGSPDSFKSVRELWNPEVRRYCSGAPVLLVGCKKDTRRDLKVTEELSRTNERPITLEEGIFLAEDICARNYLECSARTREGIREIFKQAVRAALSPDPKP